MGLSACKPFPFLISVTASVSLAVVRIRSRAFVNLVEITRDLLVLSTFAWFVNIRTAFHKLVASPSASVGRGMPHVIGRSSFCSSNVRHRTSVSGALLVKPARHYRT